MSVTYSGLKRDALAYREQTGVSIRDAVKLAAEHREPYPMTNTPFWQRCPYDKSFNGEYRAARHFIPGTPWRGGNRWQH